MICGIIRKNDVKGWLVIDTNEKKTQRLEELHEIWERMRLLNEDFVANIFDDAGCAELVLRILLQKRDLCVVDARKVEGEDEPVHLIIQATDFSEKSYDIVVQKIDSAADLKVAVGNTSFSSPKTCFVFIMDQDFLKEGLPVYHIDGVVAETGEPCNDLAHIICVDSQTVDGTPAMTRLLADFWSGNH